ncbi:TonB-dependent receptor [Reichenbachiella sp. MALMAid0571]|uniref:SusC/RagA family TonB-linked outer membrane protein n=1 Tax=Reichenbachiella sp. MALMAid0571 TaxID=3143939 RepID=UPI0032DFCDB2
MKLKVLQIIIMLTKYFAYGIFVQVLLMNLLLAENSSAQKAVSAKEVNITIWQENISVKELFKVVEELTDFTVSYDNIELGNKLKKSITVSSGDMKVSDLLLQVSKQADLKFKQVNKVIHAKNLGKLFRNEAPLVVEFVEEDVSISGKITDENGEGLPGASVVVKGTTNGTTTDLDGNYKMNIPEDGVLVVSYVGYVSQEIIPGTRNIVDLQLELDAAQLEEIVVVGYGQVKRSDLTGSVAQVELEELKDIPANSIEGLLQGRVAGLQIINNSQDPNSSAIVRIRGSSSLRGSQSPLIVVDGFPLGGASNLNQINPADIESIDVLKDASASAIYGSRGANGVIIVTTKKAKTGKTNVSVRQQSTFSQFTSEMNLWRNPVLMAQLSNESDINGGFTPKYVGANFSGRYYPSIQEISDGTWPHNVRWDDIVFRDLPISNSTTVGISSSNERTGFNLSANYFTDKGMNIQDDYKKLNYNLNVSHKVYDNLKVTFSNILTRGVRNNNTGLAFWRSPLIPVYDEEGNYYRTHTADYDHPLGVTDNRLNDKKELNVLSLLDVEWKIIPSLTINSRLNYRIASSVQDEYLPKLYSQKGEENSGQAYIRNWQAETLVSETFATYNKLFNDKHEVGVTAGYSYQNDNSRWSDLGAVGFVNEILKNENLATGDPELNIVGNGLQTSKLVSGIFRINYSYDNKYLLTFTSRTDGSSKFGENNKWAFFPSVAASWKLHEEEFIKGADVFDQLKVRASYGISGNQGINPYETLSKFGISKYYNDGAWVTSIGPGIEVGRTGQDGIEVVWGGIPTPDLRWETTSQVNVGLDMAFLNNRMNVTFDYYSKNTDDLLRQRNLPNSSGYNRMLINDGSIANKGFELTLGGDLVRSQDLNVNATLIYSRNRNEVTSLGDATQSGLIEDPNTGVLFEFYGNNIEQFRAFPNILAIGQPVNVFYGYKTDGIVQTLEEGIEAGLEGDFARPGEFKYVDIDGDGEISDNDRTIIGDPNPDFLASLNLSASYKNFDISIFLNGVFGNDVLNTKAFDQPSNTPLRWTLDNPTNEYPSLRSGRQNRFSDWWIEDGSFIRIQNLNLGYTLNLPSEITARLFMNASNLFTFSDFEGYDPEVGVDGRYYGGYPRLRRVTLGFNLTF